MKWLLSVFQKSCPGISICFNDFPVSGLVTPRERFACRRNLFIWESNLCNPSLSILKLVMSLILFSSIRYEKPFITRVIWTYWILTTFVQKNYDYLIDYSDEIDPQKIHCQRLLINFGSNCKRIPNGTKEKESIGSSRPLLAEESIFHGRSWQTRSRCKIIG